MLRRGSTLAKQAFMAIAIALCLISVPLGCGTKSQVASGDDELSRASSLIEERQYSEAIYILAERLKREPHDARSRVLLASAYAARGGISMKNYTGFTAELLKWKKIDEILPEEDDGGFIQAVAKAAVRLRLVIRAFDALPNPATAEAANDIKLAVQALTDAGTLNGGPALFRSLLKTVLLKREMLQEGLPKVDINCLANAGEIAAWIVGVSNRLESIFADVADGLADKGSKESVKKLSLEIHNAAQSVGLAVLWVANMATQAQTPSGTTAAAPATPVGNSDVRILLPRSLRKVFGKCEQ